MLRLIDLSFYVSVAFYKYLSGLLCFCLTLLLSNDNSSTQVRVLNPGKHCVKNIGDLQLIGSKVDRLFLCIGSLLQILVRLTLFLSYTITQQ